MVLRVEPESWRHGINAVQVWTLDGLVQGSHSVVSILPACLTGRHADGLPYVVSVHPSLLMASNVAQSASGASSCSLAPSINKHKLRVHNALIVLDMHQTRHTSQPTTPVTASKQAASTMISSLTVTIMMRLVIPVPHFLPVDLEPCR